MTTIFIPIKHNSQRVPNKNFRLFEGKPFWEHTVDKLKNFKVYVDTDSQTVEKSIDMFINAKLQTIGSSGTCSAH